jgi:hypothetical protein
MHKPFFKKKLNKKVIMGKRKYSESNGGSNKRQQTGDRDAVITRAIEKCLKEKSETKYIDGEIGQAIAVLAQTSTGNMSATNPIKFLTFYDDAGVSHSSQVIGTVEEGTGPSERIGKNMTITRIYMDVKFELPTRVTAWTASNDILPGGNEAWWALVLDKQYNSAQGIPVADYIYENPGGQWETQTGPLRNLEWTSRFKVLKQGTIQFDRTTPVANAQQNRMEYTGQIKTAKIAWTGEIPMHFTGATATQLQGNAIYFMCNSNMWSNTQVTSLKWEPEVHGVIRVMYKDQ